MQMEDMSQDFLELQPSLGSKSVWKGNEAFPPKSRWGRLSLLIQSCVFPHSEMLFSFGYDFNFSIYFGQYLMSVRELSAQWQPCRSSAFSWVRAVHTLVKGLECKEPGDLARVTEQSNCGTEKGDSLKRNSKLMCNKAEILYFCPQKD